MDQKKKTDQQTKELVVQRLLATSVDSGIAIGTNEYTIKDLVKHVQDDDQIGHQIIDIQIGYLRDLAQGKIYEQLEENSGN